MCALSMQSYRKVGCASLCWYRLVAIWLYCHARLLIRRRHLLPERITGCKVNLWRRHAVMHITLGECMQRKKNSSRWWNSQNWCVAIILRVDHLATAIDRQSSTKTAALQIVSRFLSSATMMMDDDGWGGSTGATGAIGSKVLIKLSYPPPPPSPFFVLRAGVV